MSRQRFARFGRTGWGLALLTVVFVAGRGWAVWAVQDPGRYGPSQTSIRRDVRLYHEHAGAVLDPEKRAYDDVDFEYPPGTLAAVVVPGLGRPSVAEYRARFTALVLLVDGAGLVGLLLLSQRWGSIRGLWAWALLVPLLGPMSYARVDLVPAVLVIWAVERASAGRWGWAGVLLGAGAAAKLYPALLAPPALSIADDRRRLALGFGVGALLPFVPFLPVMGDLVADVFGYHTQRGIQIESIWGAGIFLAVRHGYSLVVDADFGAFHFNGGVVPILKGLSTLLTLGAVGAALWYGLRRAARGSARELAAVGCVLLCLAVGAGTVFSPQFLIWVVGVLAVALCVAASPIAWLAAPLLAAVALTQFVFPFAYRHLLSIEAVPLLVLVARDVLILLSGAVGAVLLVEASGAAASATRSADPSSEGGRAAAAVAGP